MHQFTRFFAKVRCCGLAVSLLAGAAATAASAQSEADPVDGLAISESSEPDTIKEMPATEILVENGWDFNNPDSIPGFGSLPAVD